MILLPEPCVAVQSRVKDVAQWIVLGAGCLFGGVFVIGVGGAVLFNRDLYRIALSQFPAAIGLPSAALMALCIVVFLENTTGDIQFKGLGFDFHGASGPIVLWVFCFLAIAGAIKLLWQPGRA